MKPQEHSVVVSRHARYFTAGRMDAPELWVLLHGYGQLAADFLANCSALQTENRLLVAPEGLSRFYSNGFFEAPGASWMTKEARESEIQDYVAYLDAVLDAVGHKRERINVLGFSQGAPTASRWCSIGNVRANRLICWAGDVAHDLEDPAQTLGDLELTVVFGTRDKLITAKRRKVFEDRLRQFGLSYDVITFEGGHRVDRRTLEQVAAL